MMSTISIRKPKQKDIGLKRGILALGWMEDKWNDYFVPLFTTGFIFSCTDCYMYANLHFLNVASLIAEDNVRTSSGEKVEFTMQHRIDAYLVACWGHAFSTDEEWDYVEVPDKEDIIRCGFRGMSSVHAESQLKVTKLPTFNGEDRGFPEYKLKAENALKLMGLSACITSKTYCISNPRANETVCGLLRESISFCSSSLDLRYFDAFSADGSSVVLAADWWNELVNRYENGHLVLYHLESSYNALNDLQWSRSGNSDLSTFIGQFTCLMKNHTYYQLKAIDLRGKGEITHQISNFTVENWKKYFVSKFKGVLDTKFQQEITKCDDDRDMDVFQTMDKIKMVWYDDHRSQFKPMNPISRGKGTKAKESTNESGRSNENKTSNSGDTTQEAGHSGKLSGKKRRRNKGNKRDNSDGATDSASKDKGTNGKNGSGNQHSQKPKSGKMLCKAVDPKSLKNDANDSETEPDKKTTSPVKKNTHKSKGKAVSFGKGTASAPRHAKKRRIEVEDLTTLLDDGSLGGTNDYIDDAMAAAHLDEDDA